MKSSGGLYEKKEAVIDAIYRSNYKYYKVTQTGEFIFTYYQRKIEEE